MKTVLRIAVVTMLCCRIFADDIQREPRMTLQERVAASRLIVVGRFGPPGNTGRRTTTSVKVEEVLLGSLSKGNTLFVSYVSSLWLIPEVAASPGPVAKRGSRWIFFLTDAGVEQPAATNYYTRAVGPHRYAHDGFELATAESLEQVRDLLRRRSGSAAATAVASEDLGTHTRVSLFFGKGAEDEAGRKVGEMTGVTPYKPGQAQSIEQVKESAIEAIRREGRPIDPGYMCAVNIEMTTGHCTVLLTKSGAPHYQVLFNSAGLITSVGGALGSHGEGAWHREYISGQPNGAADGSQPSSTDTNQASGAAGSRR